MRLHRAHARRQAHSESLYDCAQVSGAALLAIGIWVAVSPQTGSLTSLRYSLVTPAGVIALNYENGVADVQAADEIAIVRHGD